MSAPFLFVPIFRAFDSAGRPLAGGLLYSYQAGTTTPLATYSDAAGTVQNANPVVLDSTGSATVRLGPSAYKFVLKDAGGSTQWTEDNYNPVGDNPTFTNVTATTLTLSGSLSGAAAGFSGTVSAAAITCSGDTTARGVARVARKSADTARQSTTILTNDPDLTIGINSGLFQIEMLLIFDSVAAGAGFKYATTFSGTASNGGVGMEQGFVNSAVVGPVNATGSGGSVVFGTVGTSASSNFILVNAILHVTLSGTFTVQWAQNVSTASNTTLRTDSYLKVTQLS